MTPEYAWEQRPGSALWWLREPFALMSAGFMHRNAPPESRNLEVYEWHVVLWVPTEKFIAYLPADMPEAEALDAAKTLILLSLKEKE